VAVINTRIGVARDIKGYNEETKIFDMPLLDADSTPVDLTGSTITFKTKGFVPNASITTHADLVTVSPDDSSYLRWDLTSLPKQFKTYEVKIVRTDGLVIVLNGTIELNDTIQ
jgi:hypothetical protein